MKRVLGLDLGTNSIGWAIVDVPDSDDEDGDVVAMGSRIFPAGAEIAGSKTETRAKARRMKRAMRRQIARRSRRRQTLARELAQVGLLPANDSEFQELMSQQPGELLDRALAGGALTAHQVGRVLYWFASRRGFLSLRAGGSQMVDGDSGFTPARFRLSQFDGETGERVHQGQEDLVIEFVRSQMPHHPDLITEQLLFGTQGRQQYPVRPIKRIETDPKDGSIQRFGIHGLLFFQRKVYWDQGTVGHCSLDLDSRQRRAARAERMAQRFNVWQTVVNVRVGEDQRSLALAERARLFDALWSKKTMTFGAMRKLLSLSPETAINFEQDEIKGLKGNQTDPELKKALKTEWELLTEDERDQLVFLLLGTSTEEATRTQLSARFHLSDEGCDAALKVKLPTGRMNYGRRTIARLLETLPEAADLRDAIVAAGFKPPEEAVAAKSTDLHKVTNPLVRSTLTQLTKVIAALQRSYERADGTAFDAVRIELSRDVSASAKQREAMVKQQNENRHSREAAVKLISEFAPGSENSRDAQRKARLWRDQGEQCLYCGQPISAVELFTNSVQLDHILPLSKTNNDSLANVAVVHAVENLEKSNQTPFEWAGPDRHAELVELAKSMRLSRAKMNNLKTQHVAPDAIPSSLLVQTGYINALARTAVRDQTGIEPEISRGRLTAQLLYRIGLKKDSSDHRRHAQDAAIIAITDTRLALKLAKRYAAERDYGNQRSDDWGAWEPWTGFRAEVLAKYETIFVSHRPSRKVRGQLHEETFYGKVTSPGSDSPTLYARRRQLTGGLTGTQMGQVADPVVRKALIDNLAERGLATDGGFSLDPSNPPRLPDGTGITKVRCHMNMPANRIIRPTDQPRTGVSLANNHVAYVFRNEKTGKQRVHVVARLDAIATRALPARSAAESARGEDEEFLYSVTAGDLLLLKNSSPAEQLVRVARLDEGGKRVYAFPANKAIQSKEERLLLTGDQLAALGAVKVTVPPDGEPRRASD
ncbi:MAG: type II CRISPR RNA-guided endonuclease Cas9 [Acidimicrobiia bacterium]